MLMAMMDEGMVRASVSFGATIVWPDQSKSLRVLLWCLGLEVYGNSDFVGGNCNLEECFDVLVGGQK